MLAALDVDNRAAPSEAVAACVLFERWEDGVARDTWVAHVTGAEPYVPGDFYRRELPALLAALRRAPAGLEAIIVDGYVWLAGEQAPGLGGRLHHALGGATPVVGVAKSRYRGAWPFTEVLRGRSRRPLFVSAAGVDLARAAAAVAAMHGPARIPTLLRLTDRLCREG